MFNVCLRLSGARLNPDQWRTLLFGRLMSTHICGFPAASGERVLGIYFNRLGVSIITWDEISTQVAQDVATASRYWLTSFLLFLLNFLLALPIVL